MGLETCHTGCMTFTPTAKAEVENRPWGDSLVVSTTWEGEGLDRKDGHGYAFALNKTALAARLVRAINAGVVFVNPELKTDIYGQTYVSASSKVMGKYANADLKRLGY